MVFDISLCGDWAGATYNEAGYSGSCAERVTNPENFESAFISLAIRLWRLMVSTVAAFWQIRSIKVYN